MKRAARIEIPLSLSLSLSLSLLDDVVAIRFA
jgi:hypothetical protein